MVKQLADLLLAAGPAVAYVVIGALVFAEAALFVGFVLPGETAALLGGVLAASHRLSLPTVVLLVVGSAVVGDTVGYEVGRHAGPRMLASRPLRRHAAQLPTSVVCYLSAPKRVRASESARASDAGRAARAP